MAQAPDPHGARTAQWPELRAVDRLAVRELLIHGPSSRAEIARRLGMSRASLTRVTRTLVELGLVSEGAMQVRGATGRPGELLHIRPEAASFLGVKLTGDRLYAVVTDLGAQIRADIDEPLRSREVDDVISQIGAVRDRLAREHPAIVAAGITLAGDIAAPGSDGSVTSSPFLGWSDVPLARLVQERLGIAASVENDVRSLTAAEHWFGVGAGLDSMVLLTVGVGIGFGIVVGGEVVTGAHGKAGRLDHLPIAESGPRCESCHRRCASTVLTNRSIVSALRVPGLDYDAVLALARDADPAAMGAFRDAGYALGVLIATLADTLDPQKVVITGDGIAVAELARSDMDAAIASHRHPSAAPIALAIEPFEFNEWARAGAVLAIRSCLAG